MAGGCNLTPLHKACYYGKTEAVKFMLENGGMKYLTNSPGAPQTPLEMVINQLNSEIMKYIYTCDNTIFQRVKSGNSFHSAACLILSSGVTYCLAYRDYCPRCTSDGYPHAEQASIAGCLEVLLQAPKDVVLACEGRKSILAMALQRYNRSPVAEEVLKLHKRVCSFL